VEVHYHIASCIVAAHGEHAHKLSTSQSTYTVDPPASLLAKWSVVCKTLWTKVACGGMCDDVWRSVCLKRWPHDIKMASIPASEWRGLPGGFWRKLYIARLEDEILACGGVAQCIAHGVPVRSLESTVARSTLYKVCYIMILYKIMRASRAIRSIISCNRLKAQCRS
jgi:hypothetical protein